MLKRMILGLLLVFLFAGCSRLQADRVYSQKIDLNAQAANAVAQQADTMPDADVTAALATNADTFADYANVKTVNLFALWFGGKHLLVNADYANKLDTDAVRAKATVEDAKSGALPMPSQRAVLKLEASVLQRVKDAKDGKAGN